MTRRRFSFVPLRGWLSATDPVMTISASSGVSFTECEFDTVPGGTCVIQVRSIKCGLDNALPTKEETGLKHGTTAPHTTQFTHQCAQKFQDGSECTVVCMYAYVVVEVPENFYLTAFCVAAGKALSMCAHEIPMWVLVEQDGPLGIAAAGCPK